jgi:nitronate monooxygenase
MYPCSNPELVAAVSDAGGLGVVQPISLTYVHGHEFRAGLRYIRSLTGKPIGFNALIEGGNKAYLDRMRRWIDGALEEGVRFFITSLGNPKWVCERVHAAGGVVYHDVTERKWAQKGIDGGVDGLIAVNARAGGHAGPRSPEALFEELAPFGKPIVSAGGVGTPQEFVRHLRLGYAAVQLGTRFIATHECKASDAYKQAIVDSGEEDIVLTERLTGVPVAVIRNAYVERARHEGGRVRALDAQRPQDEALDAHVVCVELDPATQEVAHDRRHEQRVLAGGQVGRGDSRGQAGRADRAGVRLGAGLIVVDAI